MNNEIETKDMESQPENKRPEERGERTIDKRGTLLYDRQNAPQSNRIRYFSMFTGVGGFELGLENAGSKSSLQGGWVEDSRSPQNLQSNRDKSCNETTPFSCVGMSEWDKYSSQVLKYKFPDIKNWGDCTKINPDELPDFDMLCGGFPCQSFSIAGKRRGFEDTRGTMFFEVARILKVKRPKTVLLENVKGLLNHNKGETFSVILETLDELGYETQWMVLNSKFFGVPQNRERVLIIGNLRGERRPEILPFRRINQEVIRQSPETLFDINQAQRVYSTEGTSITIKSGGGGQGAKTGLYAVLTPDRPNKRQNGRRFKEDGEPSFTLTGQDIHGVAITHPTITEAIGRQGSSSEFKSSCERVYESSMQIRRLTPTECCRLQGFPDDWNEWGIDEKGNKVKMSDTQRYKQMGNAVTTNVIKAIGTKLLSPKNYPTERN